MMDGMYGAIVIARADGVESPFHLISNDRAEVAAMEAAERGIQPLTISDWTQFTSTEFHRIQSAANIDLACVDAITINGIGSQYCLNQKTLDSLTHPVVLQMLKDIGENHLTDKGCLPPLPIFQGDFDLNIDKIPVEAFRKCIGGQNALGNYSVNVDTTLGWAALSFINPGSLYPLQVSIDGHQPFIFAVDGHYIKPIRADRILVNTGSRISIMMKLNSEHARYKIRVANDYLNQVLGGFADLVYDGTSKLPPREEPKMDFAGHPVSDEVISFISEDSRPNPTKGPSRHSDRTFKLKIRKLGRPYGAYEWTLTGTQGYNISSELTSPPLLFKDPAQTHEKEVIIKTKHNEWVDIILVTEGPFAQAHPMHKHGNRVFLLGTGVGSFPWDSIDEAAEELPPGTFNFNDPPYLDTFNTVEIQGGNHDTWTAIRYKAEQPGAWLFHCHVQTHLSGGMAMVILDGVDRFPEIPLEYAGWNGFEPPYIPNRWRSLDYLVGKAF